MKTNSPRVKGLFALLAPLVLATSAYSEVELSITIKGTAEELVPILQLLQDAGLGTETGPEIQVHSVYDESQPSASEAPAEPEPEPASTPEPMPEGPRFSNAALTPATVQPGGQTTLTVKLTDPENQVDTVAATVGEATGLSFDLYDNGTHGDSQAGDSTWTHVVSIPEGMASGAMPVRIVAFDAYGDPVAVGDDNTPLVAEAELTVQGNNAN